MVAVRNVASGAPRSAVRAAKLDESNLTLMTLNISGPALDRAERLSDYLRTFDVDVFVLTETRENAGTDRVIQSLQASGYTIVMPAGLIGHERGAAIAHRLPSTAFVSQWTVSLAHRLPVAHLEVSGMPIVLIGAYVPSRDTSPAKIERKSTFLVEMCNFVAEQSGGAPVILMGDLNVVGRDHVPRYSAFRSWEYETLEHLERLGLRNAHSILSPGVQAHSWIGRTGHGYQYDYGFVSDCLRSAVVACEYLHEPRELRLSDHAAVQMTLDFGVLETAALRSGSIGDYALTAV